MTVSVTGVSGTLTHGSTLTIAGTGFGTKSTAAPVVWDTWENGALNDPTVGGPWESTNDLALHSGAPQRHANSTYNVGKNLGQSDYYAFVIGPDSPLADHWFCQYWLYLHSDWTWVNDMNKSMGNIKFFRIWNPGSALENWVMAWHTGDDTIAFTEDEPDVTWKSPGSGNYCGWNPGTALTKQVWHCLQFEYLESSVGSKNGQIKWWLNGQVVRDSRTDTDDGGIQTRSGSDPLKRIYELGLFNSHGDTPINSTFYMDDVYCDNSWARVEIGDANTYSTCTQREIQCPSAWSTTEVQVVANQGSFAALAGKYLYLVDSAGVVNAAGYLLGDEETPVNKSVVTSISATQYIPKSVSTSISATQYIPKSVSTSIEATAYIPPTKYCLFRKT